MVLPWEYLVLTIMGNVFAGLVAGVVAFFLRRSPKAEGEEAAQLETSLGRVLLGRSLRMWGYYLAMLVLLAGSILSWISVWCIFLEAGARAGLSSIQHAGMIVLSWLFFIFPVAYFLLFRLGLWAIIAFEERCQSGRIVAEAYKGFFRSFVLRPAVVTAVVLSMESAGFVLAGEIFGVEGLAPLHMLVNYSSLFILGLAWLISLFLLRSPRVLEIMK